MQHCFVYMFMSCINTMLYVLCVQLSYKCIIMSFTNIAQGKHQALAVSGFLLMYLIDRVTRRGVVLYYKAKELPLVVKWRGES